MTQQEIDFSSNIYNNYQSYLGNPLLKRPGVTINWTTDLVKEYARCSQDPIYFIETYMKIINVDEGLIPFKLRDYQKEITLSLHHNRNTIIATARQAGKSTIMTGYILWYILFNDHKVVALLANKADTAQEIFSKVKLAYQHLPQWLQQGVLKWNETSIQLENGCRAFSAATSSDAVRGYAINLLVLDEAAHIENWEDFSTSVLPTITSGKTSKIVLISTPKGLNHFYTTWENAKKKKNNYHPIEVPWQRVPGRDQAWYDATLADLNFDLDKFAQEFEVQFLGSSGTLIAGWKLKELVSQIPIQSKEGLRKYKHPIKKRLYALTVDTSEGKGLDHSAFQVIDVTAMPFEQVCTFNSNLIPPPEYGQLIYQVAKTYNDAMILIEYESMGPEVADTLWSDLGYENVLMTESAGSRGKRISSKSGTAVDKGVKMTVTVKATGCSILKLLIEQNKLILNDEATINELKTFSRHLKTYRAEEGKHDDMVMALVVFAWLSNQEYFKDLTDVNTMAKLRERTEEQIDIELTPFGFVTDGMETVYDLDINPNAWLVSEDEHLNF